MDTVSSVGGLVLAEIRKEGGNDATSDRRALQMPAGASLEDYPCFLRFEG